MKILKRIESRELCTEAGWYAYDYFFEQPLQSGQIKQLAGFGGSFLYLEALKEPFYKLENTFYMIKGIQGKGELRLAVYKENEQETLKEFEEYMKNIV